jgi:hypothetical protein
MAAGMQAAFAKVGVEADARTRLNRALQKAASEFPNDIRAAAAAVQVACSRDLGMLFELTSEVQLPAAEKMLREIMNVDRKAKEHVITDDRLPTDRQGAGHLSNDTQAVIARPRFLPKPTRPVTAEVARIVANSILDTHRTENGKLLGDCTKDDLEGLARKSHARGRFYDTLASALPPTDEPLRKYITAEAASIAWRGRYND